MSHSCNDFEFFRDSQDAEVSARLKARDSWFYEMEEELVPFEVKKDPNESEEYNQVRQELYNSELAYTKFLLAVQKLFVERLHCSKLIRKSDHKVLFGELSSIYLINKEFLQYMRECNTVSEAISRVGHFLKLYASYASNYSASQKRFNKLMGRNSFREFVEKQEADSRCQGRKLPALLIMPIQRIPRYVLLLKRLRDEVKDRKENLALKDALDQLYEITDILEECIGDYEQAEKLYEIQESLNLKDEIVAPGRRLLKEGVLFKSNYCGEATYKERMFWLMSDLLVYGKRRMGLGAKYECSCIFPLRHVTVSFNDKDSSLLITCKSHSIVVTSDHFEILTEWKTAINNAVVRLKMARSTLRKESSLQQVRVFKSNIKRKITRKFLNVTYRYDVGGVRERVVGSKVQSENTSLDALSQRSSLTEHSEAIVAHSTRKRLASTEFDDELRGVVLKRRISAVDISQNSQAKRENLPEFEFQHQTTVAAGEDQCDRVPRTRSAARRQNAAEVAKSLPFMQLRKFSHVVEEDDLKTSPERPSTSASTTTSSVFGSLENIQDSTQKSTTVPWWANEATPSSFARRKERKPFTERLRDSCIIN